ncbi:hypothetical protein ACJX0J_031083, partial [Zea mays]
WVAVWQEFRGTVEEYLKEFNEQKMLRTEVKLSSRVDLRVGGTAKETCMRHLKQKLVELNNLPICTLQLFYKEPRFKLPSPFNKEFWVKASTLWYFDFWQIMFSVDRRAYPSSSHYDGIRTMNKNNHHNQWRSEIPALDLF